MQCLKRRLSVVLTKLKTPFTRLFFLIYKIAHLDY